MSLFTLYANTGTKKILTISDTQDDGYEIFGSNNWNAEPSSPVAGFNTVGNFGGLNHVGLRFVDVPIVPEVKYAGLKINRRRTAGSPTAVIYGVDADAAPAFDDSTNYPSNTGALPRTTATATYTNYSGAALTYIEEDVTDIVNEILGRAGFAGVISFLIISTSGGTAIDSLEDLNYVSGDNPAKLILRY